MSQTALEKKAAACQYAHAANKCNLKCSEGLSWPEIAKNLRYLANGVHENKKSIEVLTDTIEVLTDTIEEKDEEIKGLHKEIDIIKKADEAKTDTIEKQGETIKKLLEENAASKKAEEEKSKENEILKAFFRSKYPDFPI